MGDLNGWVRNGIKVDISVAVRVVGKNDNGKRMFYFCADRG